MFMYPLQPHPHIQYPASFLHEDYFEQQVVDYRDISYVREPVHVIEKSLDSLSVFLIVGSLLSAMITGSLATMETYVDCPVTPALSLAGDTGGLALVCTAASNKLATVVTAVWLPIITFCLLRYYKTDTLNHKKMEKMKQVFVK